MADFIAVIRRAVDGLSENTPELRAKVYERARAAVVRQLENMKPRPPEAMFQRQLEKLDAAIAEVEAEHGVALPAEIPSEEGVAAAATPVPDEPLAAEAPEERAGPVVADETIEGEQRAEDDAGQTTAEALPVADADDQFQPVADEHGYPEEVPADRRELSDSVHVTERTEDVPAAETTHAVAEAQWPETPAYVEEPGQVAPGFEPLPEEDATAREPEDHAEEILHTPRADAQDYAPVAAEPSFEEPLPVATEQAYPVEIDQTPETFVPEDDERQPPMPRVTYDEADVVSGFNAFVQEEISRQVVPPPPPRQPEKNEDFSWDAPFDDLPELPRPEAFDVALKAKQEELAAQHVAEQAAQATAVQSPEPLHRPQPHRDPKAELEDLIGFDPRQSPPRDELPFEPVPAPEEVPTPEKREQKSFKLPRQGERKGNGRKIAMIAGIVVAVALMGGIGFAGWLYKDEVAKLVAGLMPSSSKEDKASAADTAPSGSANANNAKSASTPTKTETQVAAVQPNSGPQKFTERLLPDGSEQASDSSPITVDQALTEGKTVAGQTEKPKQVAEADGQAQPAGGTAGASTAPATQAGDATQASDTIANGQKMFLYEERIGQSSPVATQGIVSWTEKNETDDNGKTVPAIVAQIDVPGRNLKAMITFKRNDDPSLPASHIIEIVFDLPKTFEEGNVDKVTKVAFKQTEQATGNPLVAVPAKVTDDFHMVALNSDPEAISTNIELMKTRPWIDIALMYRNGRKALITLEKGPSGEAVFNKVLGEWDALGNTSANQ